MKVATIVLMNECSNSKCRRRPVVAERVSDFWVTKCEACRQLPTISLDKHSMKRIQNVYSSKKAKAA